jgi:two-component system chemotaxis response regulator CheY
MSSLVVDDEPAVTRLVTRLLRTFYLDEIATEHDGAAALELLHQNEYQLVLSDFQMEPITGLELLAAVRANPRLRQTAFLMMAGGTEIDQVSAAYRAGIDGYVLKPFTASMLRSKIKQVFRGRLPLLS